ncbi:nucleoredoxin, partial [Tachysurus ichikawai]
CPPCRSLTRVLVESYRKVKESGHKFEIVFVSADRSEDSFTQYFSEMPWLAVPYTDEARRSRLNRLYGIQGCRFFPQCYGISVKARAGGVFSQIPALPLGKLSLPPHQMGSCYQSLGFKSLLY